MDLKSLQAPPTDKLAWIGQLNPPHTTLMPPPERLFQLAEASLQCYTMQQRCTTQRSMLTSQNKSTNTLPYENLQTSAQTHYFWVDVRH